MLNDFLVRTALAGVGTALAAGPLGCFVVWRQLAYFGEATAHAAILGVALSLILGTAVLPGVLLAALAMAALLSRLSNSGLSEDTALGVLAHSSLAIGVFAIALSGNARIDLEAYLFGDILSVNRTDLAVIWGGGLLVTGLLIWRWDRLLTATLNPDLAYAAGLKPGVEQAALTVGLAIVVAVALKVVGVLLIVSLLLIPAATARPFAATPERMAVLAAVIGAAAALLGLGIALVLDTPAGPSIVTAAAFLFAVSTVAERIMARG